MVLEAYKQHSMYTHMIRHRRGGVIVNPRLIARIETGAMALAGSPTLEHANSRQVPNDSDQESSQDDSSDSDATPVTDTFVGVQKLDVRVYM